MMCAQCCMLKHVPGKAQLGWCSWLRALAAFLQRHSSPEAGCSYMERHQCVKQVSQHSCTSNLLSTSSTSTHC